MRTATACVALALLASAAGVRAQRGAADGVPSDVRSMLITPPFGGAAIGAFTIQTTVPENFPRELLPEGATVMAAAVAATATSIVVRIEGQSTDLSRLQWLLEPAGWIGTGPMMMGFSMGPTPRPMTVCKGSDFAHYMSRSSPSGALVRVLLMKEPLRSCAPTGLRTFSDVPLPTLSPPPGLRISGGSGGGGGMDDRYSRARFEGAVSVADTTAYFIEQMKAAGWSIEGQTLADGVMSVTRFTTKSRAGDPVTALLTLMLLSETPYMDAMLRVVRNKPVR